MTLVAFSIPEFISHSKVLRYFKLVGRNVFGHGVRSSKLASIYPTSNNKNM